MSTALIEGSEQWFEVLRRDLAGDLRLLQDFTIAHGFLQKLLNDWDSVDPATNAALHTSCVVAYARPFKESIGKTGKKFRYPVSRIKAAPGFDGALHEHLLSLRDRMVAHSDAELADRVVHLGVIDLKTDQLSGRVVFEAGVQAAAIYGFSKKDLAEKYHTHVEAGIGAANQLLSQGLRQYLQAAQTYPSTALAEDEETRKLHAATLQIPGGSTGTTKLPSNIALLRAPIFESNQDAYSYTIFERKARRGGAVVLTAEDGSEHKMELNWHADRPSAESAAESAPPQPPESKA